jgi:hypothetical protein
VGQERGCRVDDGKAHSITTSFPFLEFAINHDKFDSSSYTSCPSGVWIRRIKPSSYDMKRIFRFMRWSLLSLVPLIFYLFKNPETVEYYINLYKTHIEHDNPGVVVRCAFLEAFPFFFDGDEIAFLHIIISNASDKGIVISSASISINNSEVIKLKGGAFGQNTLRENPEDNKYVVVRKGAEATLKISQGIQFPGLSAYFRHLSFENTYCHPYNYSMRIIGYDKLAIDLNREFARRYGNDPAITVYLYTGKADMVKKINLKLNDGISHKASGAHLLHSIFLCSIIDAMQTSNINAKDFGGNINNLCS